MELRPNLTLKTLQRWFTTLAEAEAALALIAPAQRGEWTLTEPLRLGASVNVWRVDECRPRVLRGGA